MDISDCTQIHIDMELNYKFTIKLIKSKLNPCDVGYGESFLKLEMETWESLKS